MSSTSGNKTKISALTLAALGVVFGDIGTSPLYTMKEVFSAGMHPVPLTATNMYGILSLIFWALVMVVSVKYVVFIMRADNRGEGGIMALLALASHNAGSNLKKQRTIMLIGILGACMFYADGMITPAISVLSAVEGLELSAPMLHPLILPVTLVVLFILFWAQSKGTALVGAFFGPIMLLWFGTLAVLGMSSILQNPSILHALNPIYAPAIFYSQPMDSICGTWCCSAIRHRRRSFVRRHGPFRSFPDTLGMVWLSATIASTELFWPRCFNIAEPREC